MRIAAISLPGLLALLPLTGCVTLHADVPADVVRQHAAREHGVELGAICSYDGSTFSEGAVACMSGQRMTCDDTGRWVPGGDC